MQLYSIPEKIKTFIFDIDGTLYTCPEFVAEQIDVQIRHYAHINKISEDDARNMIENYRAKWSAQHNGKKISLGNTFPAFGIDIETSIKWRNELLQPEKFLQPDLRLRKFLEKLGKSFNLICVTNNPVKAARRTLEAAGISDVIPDVIGLDTCMKSKPAIEMLELAAKKTSSNFCECVSVGDRFDIDIALPLELGMGGILVKDASDVVNIPGALGISFSALD
ncbi:HAD family hydrolase [Treponema sp.]|uniref:HAD family hydrolase n=1 Tax=Treponema sp. TaxID=166 RepID=UPI003EFEF97E